jgi:hypothetical protein
MEEAQAHALSEWERYRIVQDQLFTSDFDLLIESSITELKSLTEDLNKKTP